MIRLVLLIILALPLCGCPHGGGQDGGSGNPDGGALHFDIGTADVANNLAYSAMTPQVAGQSGAQGGFHVYLMYRLPEGGVGSITFNHQARLASNGTLVSRGSRTYDLGSAPLSNWTSPDPVRVFMCPTPVGVNIVGQALTLEVTATDDSGAQLGVSNTQTTFTCSSSYCESTCKG
jgi:hypothetical protein